MKKKFVLIALVAILGLSSCDKIYDEIAALNDRVTELEDTTIAAINEQISNINTSISYLEVVDAELNGYIKTLQEVSAKLQNDIEAVDTRLSEVQTSMENQMSAMKTELDSDILMTQADLLAQLQSLKDELEAELEQINATILVLKSKDDELEKNISSLRSYVDDELSKTADWVAATYSTLDQYELLCTDIATIKAQIETLNSSLVELETRLNDKISTDIATAVEILNANMDTAIDGLYAEISSQITAVTTAYTSAITSAKEEVTAAYTTEIATAVTNLEASMKLWVNEQLANYYTIAQVDAMLVAMSEEFEGKLSSQKIYLESLISSLSDVLLAKISTNGDLIATLRNDITSLDAEVARNAEAIVANAEKIAANANAIKANTEDIIENSKRIEANAEQIDSNAILSAEKIEEATAVLTQKIEANTALINENRQLIGDVDAKIDNTNNVENAKAIAENAKAIAEQAELIAKNSVAISNNATAIATNSVEIENIKKQIISVKDEITKAYTELIETSIETLEGKLDNAVIEINTRISNEVKSINVAIETLETRVEAVEKEIAVLKEIITSIQGDIAIIQDQISALISRIQSVTYIPKYSDGKATMDYGAKMSELDFLISPKSAVEELATLWNSALAVKAVYTQTRTVDFIDLPIVSFEADNANGVISLTVSGENLNDNFFVEQQDAGAFLQISVGNSHIASDYIAMTPNYNIKFEDLNVKAICCKNWDTNVDGELSYAEAAAVTSIGTVFRGNANIYYFTELKYFTGLTSFAGYAFSECLNLIDVEIPINVVSIGDYAFEKTSVKKISIPKSTMSIGRYAFRACAKLQNLIISDGVVEILEGAFSGCGKLKKIMIPNSVEILGREVFNGCSGVKYVYIGNGVLDYKSPFDNYTYRPFGNCGGELICYSQIYDPKVFSCTEFSKVTLGYSRIIGRLFDEAGSSIETVILDKNVKEIDSYALDYSYIKFVYCKSNTPPQIGPYSAFKKSTLEKLYVPLGCAELYKNAENWTQYASKIEEYDFENNPI